MKGSRPRQQWRRIWLCFLSLLTIVGLSGTSWGMTIEVDRQLEYADSLFNQKQYLRAAEEYQRFVFFFPDHSKNRAIRLKSGEAFLLAGDPKSAISVFKELSTMVPPDQPAIEAFFRMADAYMDLKLPTHALVQLNNVVSLSDDGAAQDRAYYRMGWIHVEYADWESARKAWTRISAAGRPSYRVDELDQALAGAAALPTKRPALAGALSIVPGAGQLYCQRYEDALIAFVVNVGLGWAAYDAFDNEQYGLGGLLSFVGLGFYAGNIYGAVNDAHKYNRGQKRRFVDQLRQQHLRLSGLPPGVQARPGPLLTLTIPF